MKLKKIIDREICGGSNFGGNSWKLFLECGHIEYRKASAPMGIMVKCRDCELGRTHRDFPNAFQATLMLGEDNWQMEFPIGVFKSKADAKSAADAAECEFRQRDGESFVHCFFNNTNLFLENVVIKELSQEALRRLGPTLDVSIPENRETALTALVTHDPKYALSAADFVPSNKTLADFINRYGDGYRPDCLAYGIIERQS